MKTEVDIGYMAIGILGVAGVYESWLKDMGYTDSLSRFDEYCREYTQFSRDDAREFYFCVIFPIRCFAREIAYRE